MSDPIRRSRLIMPCLAWGLLVVSGCAAAARSPDAMPVAHDAGAIDPEADLTDAPAASDRDERAQAHDAGAIDPEADLADAPSASDRDEPVDHVDAVDLTSTPVFDYVPCVKAQQSEPEPCGQATACTAHADEVVGRQGYPVGLALALLDDEPVVAWAGTLARHGPSGWSTLPLSGSWVALSNANAGLLTVGLYGGAYDMSFQQFDGNALTPLRSVTGILQQPLLRDGCGSTLALPWDNRAGHAATTWLSFGATTAQTVLSGSLGGADMAIAPNQDLHVVYLAHSGAVLAARALLNGKPSGEVEIYQLNMVVNLPTYLAAFPGRNGSSDPHFLYRDDRGHGRWMHAWSNDNSTWQQEPVLSDDLTDDCVETQPTATGQVCDERVTRYQVVDVARSEAGSVRWIVTVERESGIYTATCQPRLDDPYGGLACVWNPSASVTRTLSLILGSLRGDTIQFTPVPGLSWAMDPGSGPLFARGASAIDSMGWIHIAYHLAQPSPVEIHHLVLSPG